MRILSIRTLSGPNVYSHSPTLLARLDLEDLADKKKFEVPGFVDRVLADLPGLRSHHCGSESRQRRLCCGQTVSPLSYQCPEEKSGLFLERLSRGFDFGHLVTHVALELMTCAGLPVLHGKTQEADGPGLCNLIVEYKAEETTRFLLKVAVELVESVIKGNTFPLEERLEEARDIAYQTELGPSTRAIVDAADLRNVPWARIGDGSIVQLGYGKHRRFIQAATSSNTCSVAVEIACDKELAKELLKQASIPVPLGETVETEEGAIAAAEQVGGPVVIKPLDGQQGKGVSLNLTTPDEVRRAFQIASDYSSRVLVEEMLAGQDYRVLVVNGKMVAASIRRPCNVIGDGLLTIRELIEVENQNPLRGEGHEKPLTKIPVDAILLAYLQKKGLSLDSRPELGERVYLREGANLSKGGTAADVTDLIHPEIARMCERAARVIGLDICGIDLILEEIFKPVRNGHGGIIEVNASPGLRMHLHPSEGEPRDVGAAIIDMLYPPGSPSRVPVISITGTNGKTTVTRMISHVLSRSGEVVGMTTTEGIYIGGQLIADGDTTGPHSARTVLSDPAVEVAVLETARGGITRRGLGYDRADVAVLTNVRCDHIGQDGIKSVEDLVYIKSLIAERVREGGTLILNADDEQLARLMEIPRVRRGKKNVVYFSLSENHPLVKQHLSAGGTAYYLKGGWIVEATGQRRNRIVSASAIPIREDKDLRGRNSGEAARLLCQSVVDEVAGNECRIVLDECEALEQELREMGEGDIIVMFYDNRDKVVSLLQKHGAVVAATIEESTAQVSMAGITHGGPATNLAASPAGNNN